MVPLDILVSQTVLTPGGGGTLIFSIYINWADFLGSNVFIFIGGGGGGR